jgi:chemotaxis signal transduction protein
MSERAPAGPKVVFCQIGEGRYTISADIVTRGVTARIVPLPWLSDGLAGLVVVENQVVPVIDPRVVLARGEADDALDQRPGHDELCHDEPCELILVVIAGDSYAVVIDRVLGVAARGDAESEFSQGGDQGDDIRALDIAAIIDTLRIARVEPRPVNADGLVPVASLPPAVVVPPSRLAGAALVVETEHGSHVMSLAGVSHTFDVLPVTAVPDPNPMLAGAALYQGRWIAVVRLDGLLGESMRSDDEMGGYVVVQGGGEPVAVGVKRIVGVSQDSDSSRQIVLTDYLGRMLAKVAASENGIDAITPAAAGDGKRYLRFELASQCCAVDADLVANVLGTCHVLPAPPSSIVGLAGIAVIAGRALPLLNAFALLGIGQPVSSAAGYVVLGRSVEEQFVVPVSHVGRVVSISDDACARPPEAALISAITAIADQTVWILSTEALVRRSGWNKDAA